MNRFTINLYSEMFLSRLLTLADSPLDQAGHIK